MKWILAKEERPPERVKVLTTTKRGEVEVFRRIDNKYWNNGAVVSESYIVAWTALPEPYRKKEMTSKEAIEVLEYTEPVTIQAAKAFEMAIGALKKQIPMKPRLRTQNLCAYKCAVCGHLLEEEEYYCQNCGQYIDWEEIE